MSVSGMAKFKFLVFICVAISIGSTYDVYFMTKLCNQTMHMQQSDEWRIMVNRSERLGEGRGLNCYLRIETGPARTINATLSDELIHMDINGFFRGAHGEYARLQLRDGSIDSSFLDGEQRLVDRNNHPIGPTYFSTTDNILYLYYTDGHYPQSARFSVQVESKPAGIHGMGFMDNHCNGTIDMAAIGTETYYLKGTSHYGGTYRTDRDCSLVFRSKPSEALRVELVNASIEQCKGCNCDWLEVRDGEHSDSHYIQGVDNQKICGMLPKTINVTRVYTTTQNTLFLRFVSDRGDVYHGFEMKISRVLNEKAIRNTILVKCQDSQWNIQLDLDRLGQMFPGVRTSDIYLGENSCTPTLVEGKYTFQNGFDECLTSRRVQNGVNVFSNEIINVERNPQFTFLIKRYVWRVQVECDVDANGTALAGGFKNEVDLTKLTAGSSGTAVNMSFYSDPNFATQIFGNPLKSSPGAHVYLKVFIPNIDFDKKMLLKSCYIEPTLDAADNLKYYLIKNGCEVDTNTHFIAQQDHETRLVFDYFEYAGNSQGVYVVCNAITCETTETTQNCIQTCNPVRKRSAFVPNMLADT